MAKVFPDQQHVDRIKQALWRPDEGAAVMVGAGFSRNARPLRPNAPPMPGWADLTQRLAHELSFNRPMGGASDATRVAERYRQEFGDAALESLLESAIRQEDFAPGELHRQLLRLPWSDVFTTNFDTLLETAATQQSHRRYDIITDQRKLIGRRRPSIVKLHGTVNTPGSIVISEEDFRRYPKDRAAFVNTVRQAMIEKVFVLIGFSGDDPNFNSWLGWVRDELGSAAHKIYLCGWLELSVGARSSLQDANIVPIDFVGHSNAELWRDNDRHAQGLRWLFQELEDAEPDPPEQWPNIKRLTAETTGSGRHPLPEEHTVPGDLMEELNRWDSRSKRQDGSAHANALLAWLTDAAEPKLGVDAIKDAAAFLGALSYIATAWHARRMCYPGWPVLPGRIHDPGTVEAGPVAFANFLDHYAAAWAGLEPPEAQTTAETQISAASYKGIGAFLRALAPAPRHTQDKDPDGAATEGLWIEAALAPARARLFCFLRELCARLSMAQVPIQPHWPHLSLLIDAVLALPLAPQAAAEKWHVIHPFAEACRQAGHPLFFESEQSPGAIISGLVDLINTRLEDARDRGDLNALRAMHAALGSFIAAHPEYDLDWRAFNAMRTAGAMQAQPPRTFSGFAELQDEPTDVLLLVQATALDMLFREDAAAQGKLKRATQILDRTNAGERQRIAQLSRQAWTLRARLALQDGKVEEASLIQRRLIALAGVTDPEVEHRQALQTPRNEVLRYRAWRVLLATGWIPRGDVQEGLSLYLEAARHFERGPKPDLAQSARIALFLGVGPEYAEGLRVFQSDGLRHLTQDALADLKRVIATAAEGLAKHGHTSSEAARDDRFLQDRLKTWASLATNLARELAEREQWEEMADLMQTACDIDPVDPTRPTLTRDPRAFLFAPLKVLAARLPVRLLRARFLPLLKLPLRGGTDVFADIYRRPLRQWEQDDGAWTLADEDHALIRKNATVLINGVSEPLQKGAVLRGVALTGSTQERAGALMRLLCLQELNLLPAELLPALLACLEDDATQYQSRRHETIAFGQSDWLAVAFRSIEGKTRPAWATNAIEAFDRRVWAALRPDESSEEADAKRTMKLINVLSDAFQPLLTADVAPSEWPERKLLRALAADAPRWAAHRLAGRLKLTSAQDTFVSGLFSRLLLPRLRIVPPRATAGAKAKDAALIRTIADALSRLVLARLPYEAALVQAFFSQDAEQLRRIARNIKRQVRDHDPAIARAGFEAVREWRRGVIADNASPDIYKIMKSEQAHLVEHVASLLLEPAHPNTPMALECLCDICFDGSDLDEIGVDRWRLYLNECADYFLGLEEGRRSLPPAQQVQILRATKRLRERIDRPG